MIYPVEDRILTKVAETNNMSKSQIKFIVDTQFEFVKTVVSTGEGKSVRLKHLGKFHVIEKHKERFNEKE